jgi:hypothetical protein
MSAYLDLVKPASFLSSKKSPLGSGLKQNKKPLRKQAILRVLEEKNER